MFQQLADKFVYMDNLKFARIDGTKNDVSGLIIEGYPSFYYYGVGENQRGVHFNGAYEVPVLTKFLQTQMGEDFMVDEDHVHQAEEEVEEIDPDL